LPNTNAGASFTLGRDGFEVFRPPDGLPIKETLTLLPGVYMLVINVGVFNPVGSSSSGGFNVQLAFGP